MTRSKMQTQPFFFCIRPHLTHIFPKDIFPPSHWIRNCLALRGSYPQFSEHRFEALRDGQSAAVVGEMKEITRLVFFFVAFFHTLRDTCASVCRHLLCLFRLGGNTCLDALLFLQKMLPSPRCSKMRTGKRS